VIGSTFVMKNITDERAVEATHLKALIALENSHEQLRESQAAAVAQRIRFERLVESVDGIVWEADGTTFEFTFVSQKAERFLGHPIARWFETGFWVSQIHPSRPRRCPSSATRSCGWARPLARRLRASTPTRPGGSRRGCELLPRADGGAGGPHV
jgi:PAS domain-containing protein